MKLIAVVIGCGLAVAFLHADSGGGAVAPVVSSSSSPAVESGSRRLPTWLGLKAEARGRLEYGSGMFTEGAREFVYLDRIRLETRIAPLSWLQVHMQAQDSRAPFLLTRADRDGPSNSLEFRQAYVEVRGSNGFNLRAGRQSLKFADASLIGSDDEWCNLGRAFDAASVSYRFRALSATAFSGRVVEQGERYWDRSTRDKQISGFFGQWTDEAHGLELQPFLFRKKTRGELERSVYTFGAFGSGRWASTELSGQWAFQRGVQLAHPVDARAFSVGASRSLGSRLTLSGGFKQASGGAVNDSSKFRTFDDLYPPGYNPAGIVDPFAWRNLRDASAGLTWRATHSVDVIIEHHFYWLASLADGLYEDDGLPIALTPRATNPRVGGQTNVAFSVPLRKSIRLLLGGAHFEAGPWLHEAGFHRPQNTAYLSVLKSF